MRQGNGAGEGPQPGVDSVELEAQIFEAWLFHLQMEMVYYPTQVSSESR